MPVSFNRTDLEYLLQQILMAEAGQPPVNVHLAFGLRELAGTNNNAVPGQSNFGATDQVFPTMTQPYFQVVTVNVDGTPFDPNPGVAGDTMTTTYASTVPGAPAAFGVNVIDPAPRIISNLISDLSVNNPAAVQAALEFGAQLGDGYTVFNTNPAGTALTFGVDGIQGTADDFWGADGIAGTADDVDTNNLFIGNITPDAGLSAPFNGWMAFFGQFFDHGLDLIAKGGNGNVFIPLQPDDPLILVGPDGIANTGDEVSPQTAFMVLSRATDLPGPDGILGTADDLHQFTNTTSPFVDQNQTYASDGSHNAFLREYMIGVDGRLHSTGKMLQHTSGAGADGILGDDPLTAADESADDVRSGMATWADLKANAEKMMGLILIDQDIGHIPLLATDPYGNYIGGPNGRFQIVVEIAGVATLFELSPQAPLTLAQIESLTGGTILYTGHQFLNDIAQTANPFDAQTGAALVADDDGVAGPVANPNYDPLLPAGPGNMPYLPQAAGTYDDELLDAHYQAGDGRVNENIALTAIHAIFHDEHNRLVEATKALIRAELANGDTSFALNWVLPGANLADGIQENEWNGERLMQVAKFGTETQYQHLVFEEFARKVAPTIHLFGNVDIHLDAAIVSEFANAVYRFGHSMLDENVPLFELNPDGTIAIDPATGQPILTNAGLIEAFTNPLLFANIDPAQIVQGATHQIGSEIDEFVTGALRNNLLGLPLDLAALNIARGRDTGVAPLNLVRAQIYAATSDASLKPYASWAEFGQFLKHAASLINFVAAYGTHVSVHSASTLVEKRDAAIALVTLGLDEANSTAPAGSAERDAYDFMHSLGVYANDLANPLSVHATWSTGSITGLDNIDLWIGGLAEKQNLFGGLLGSTFNFIFETQLEALQDGDRLYYLPRIEGLHFGTEIENNTFAELIMTNTGARHLSASIFLTPEYTVEAADYFQRNPDGSFILDSNGQRVAVDSSLWLRNPVTGALLVEVLPDGTVHFIGDDNFFGNTMVLGGTSGNDRLQAGHADDDTVWGDGGDDWIDGGNGNDQLFGGDGNDTIVDSAGDDVIHGEAGNDIVFAGIGDDIVFGGDGNDILDGGAGLDEISGGLGNDIIGGGEDDDALIGNEGDDWLEGGTGGDILVGDQGAPTGQVPLFAGNDVLIGGAQGDRMQGFSGDDIMLGEGGFDTFDGRLGYDWADFERETQGISVDMSRAAFIAQAGAPGGDAIRDIFIETEGVSGTRFDDILLGSNPNVLDPLFNALTNVNLIFGLSAFFPAGPVNFSGGNIMLGGDGSDFIMGRGGNDIIDGDAWLHVFLDANNNIVRQIRYDLTPGDIDTAVYGDVFANYTISGPDAQGFYTISHNVVSPGVVGLVNEGVDRVRNIERLQFSDITVQLDQSPNANHIPTGTLTVQDATNLPTVTPVVGSPLSFINTIADADGIVAGSMTFQWQYLDPVAAGGGVATWVNIAGATGETFTPSAFVLGVPLRVVATFVDGLGFMEHVASAPTAIVLEGAAINTAPFVVQQQGLVGLPDTAALTGVPINLFLPLTTVFADNQTPSNLLLFGATLANGAALSTVGLTFTLIPDGAGGVTGATITGTVANPGAISIRVTATDIPPLGASPTPLTVTDTFDINVIEGDRAPVTAGAAEVVSGLEDTPITGTLLTGSDPDGDQIIFGLTQFGATHGTVTSFNVTTGAFTFLGAPDFAGVATFQYYVTDGLLNSAPKTVTVNIAPTNDGAAPLTITGAAVTGATLSALIGVDPDGPWDPALATYEWFRDGVSIAPPSNNSNYIVTANDVGHVLSARATYIDGQGFHETTSAALADPVGVFELRPITGVNTATLFVVSAFTDPDGNPLPDAIFMNWEVSVNGVNWTAAPGNRIGANGQTLSLLTNSVQYVRAQMSYVDGASNFNTIYTPIVRAVTGTNGIDALTGVAGIDVLFGFVGDDTMNGAAGNDFLVAGGGNDLLTGGDGNDTIYADNGNDTIFATINDGDDYYDGGDGSGDTYDLSAINAGVSVDLALGTSTSAETGNDVLLNIERVTGGAGGDNIRGDSGSNLLIGNAGDDTLYGGLAGADSLRGGLGNDTYIVDRATGITLVENLDEGVDTILTSLNALDIGPNLENITFTGVGAFSSTGNALNNAMTGGASGDTLIGNNGDDTLIGNGGDDILLGGNGIDIIFGGAGADHISGDSGNDLLTGGDGDDVVDGGNSNDTFFATVGDGNDIYDGGASVGDVYDFSVISADVFVDLATGTSSSSQTGTDTLVNIERVTGGSGNDTIRGDNQANLLIGGAGNDVLYGGSAGVDSLRGGLGDDTYLVDRATDVTVVELLDEGVDTILTTLNTLNLPINVENITFIGNGTFSSTGNALNNVMTGGASADVLNGGNGDDTLIGGDGADTLNGGNGVDILIGGGGDDIMNGNSGSDVFVMTPGFGHDTIIGFDAVATGGQDLIDLQSLGISSEDFSTRVVISTVGSDTIITIDGSDSITLLGVNGVGANSIDVNDFLLSDAPLGAGAAGQTTGLLLL